MLSAPVEQHRWLEQLVGEWAVESECVMGPDQAPAKSKGTEIVRSLGGQWVICEGKGELPGSGGDVGQWIMTLGYDPAKGHYIGSWVGSMMPMMWVYHGSVDPTGKILPLNTVGPNFADGGKTQTNFQDVIEFHSPDHRTLRSQMQQPDGSWSQFMEAHYRRVK